MCRLEGAEQCLLRRLFLAGRHSGAVKNPPLEISLPTLEDFIEFLIETRHTLLVLGSISPPVFTSLPSLGGSVA